MNRNSAPITSSRYVRKLEDTGTETGCCSPVGGLTFSAYCIEDGINWGKEREGKGRKGVTCPDKNHTLTHLSTSVRQVCFCTRRALSRYMTSLGP